MPKEVDNWLIVEMKVTGIKERGGKGSKGHPDDLVNSPKIRPGHEVMGKTMRQWTLESNLEVNRCKMRTGEHNFKGAGLFTWQ